MSWIDANSDWFIQIHKNKLVCYDYINNLFCTMSLSELSATAIAEICKIVILSNTTLLNKSNQRLIQAVLKINPRDPEVLENVKQKI